MPVNFTVTKEDILRGKVLNPGWYRATIKSVTQKTANDGQSMNTWVDFIVVGGPKQEDGSEPVHTPLRRCFSEKAPGFIIPFLKACGATVSAEGGNFDISKAEGKTIDVYVKNRLYENQVQNDVADFKAVAA